MGQTHLHSPEIILLGNSRHKRFRKTPVTAKRSLIPRCVRETPLLSNVSPQVALDRGCMYIHRPGCGEARLERGALHAAGTAARTYMTRPSMQRGAMHPSMRFKLRKSLYHPEDDLLTHAPNSCISAAAQDAQAHSRIHATSPKLRPCPGAARRSITHQSET